MSLTMFAPRNDEFKEYNHKKTGNPTTRTIPFSNRRAYQRAGAGAQDKKAFHKKYTSRPNTNCPEKRKAPVLQAGL